MNSGGDGGRNLGELKEEEGKAGERKSKVRANEMMEEESKH